MRNFKQLLAIIIVAVLLIAFISTRFILSSASQTVTTTDLNDLTRDSAASARTTTPRTTASDVSPAPQQSPTPTGSPVRTVEPTRPPAVTTATRAGTPLTPILTVPKAAPTKPATQPKQTDGTGELPPLWGVPTAVEDLVQQHQQSIVSIQVQVPASGTLTSREQISTGTIYSSDGLIVTNGSNLDLAISAAGQLSPQAKVSVRLFGSNSYIPATYLGRDPISDLALLRVEPGAQKLVPANFLDEPVYKIGQMVFALGYPGDMIERGGLSSGFITALQHPVVQEDGTELMLLQTDAFIARVASGGVLMNLQGQVIGLTNCELERGYGDREFYAIPSSAVNTFVNQLLKAEGGAHPWLGITVLTDESFAKLRQLYSYPNGLYIRQIVLNSPAYTADLRVGDIITRLDNAPVRSTEDLAQFMEQQQIGNLVVLTIYRRSEDRSRLVRIYLQEAMR